MPRPIGYVVSEETKNKIRLSLLGRTSPLRGTKRSEETKRKISESNKGKVRTPEMRLHASIAMMGKSLGSKNGNYKGGCIDHGYRRVYVNGIKMYEHEKIWLEQSEWRFIPDGFVVHHKNGNKLDNRIDNLACIPRDIHMKMHSTIRQQ